MTRHNLTGRAHQRRFTSLMKRWRRISEDAAEQPARQRALRRRVLDELRALDREAGDHF